MAWQNNEPPIPIGLIADNQSGPRLVSALTADARLALRAQAGILRDRADADFYDDPRALLVQAQLSAVLVAASPRLVADLTPIATGAGIAVWCRSPLGRSFAEAAEAVQLARAAGVGYRVASWWEQASEAVLWALQREADFEPRYAELTVSQPGPPVDAWQADRRKAGGGVLTQEAYPLLESAIAIYGLPETVQAAVGQARQFGSTPRETEDVISAIIRFERGVLLDVRATYDLPPYGTTLIHHGRQHSVRYSPDTLAIVAADGSVRESRQLDPEPLAADLAAFADLLCSPEPPEPDPLERHLAVAATLEATYLSARTGQPESPRKLYEVQRWPLPNGFLPG